MTFCTRMTAANDRIWIHVLVLVLKWKESFISQIGGLIIRLDHYELGSQQLPFPVTLEFSLRIITLV
ncbi:hypothetical protein K1719_003905 [Acacia pycnantha]|nr:hypothetical protein K1719_003905 [Acacia pycnantha]